MLINATHTNPNDIIGYRTDNSPFLSTIIIINANTIYKMMPIINEGFTSACTLSALVIPFLSRYCASELKPVPMISVKIVQYGVL